MTLVSWGTDLPLVVFLRQVGPGRASLLQHGSELADLLVSLGQGGKGLLLQQLSLGLPVDTLQSDTHTHTHTHTQ